MGTLILAQKSGHGACVASIKSEKQNFSLKYGVRVALIVVTTMDYQYTKIDAFSGF